MTFHYSSYQSHGVMTPNGKRVKETKVEVENGQGVKQVTIADEKGIHSDTMPLTKSEMKNIQNHIFMPKLFHAVTKRVMKHKKTMQHKKRKMKTMRKKGSRTHRKGKKGA